MANFDSAFEYTLLNEGEDFTNVKFDKGGPTKFGIIVADVTKWKGFPAKGKDVENLTRDDAKAIYKTQYWDPLHLDKLKDQSIAVAIYDIGVVCGIGTATKMAQKVCGLTQDGQIGPITVTGLNTMGSERFLTQFVPLVLYRFIDITLNNHTQLKFLKGWSKRAMRLLTLI